MKLKTTAIALAVAGIVAAPMAAQAEGSIYASARVGLGMTSTDDADTFTATSPTTFTTTSTDGLDQSEIHSWASRFGAKGETDLGNGMSAFGKYEWDVDMDGSDGIKKRHRYVGVKGDFGSVTVGQTYHTFFNHVVGPLDNPWWGSGYTMVAYVGRTDNAITYAGSSGAIDFGATAYMVSDTEEEDIDEIELGASFPLGDTTIGVAMKAFQGDDDSTTPFFDEEEEIIGVTWSGIGLGDTTLGVGFQARDEDTSVVIDWLIGNAYVHFESLSADEADADPTSVTLGYTQNLGRNTDIWYEIQAVDNDGNGEFTDVDESGDISAGDTFEESADTTYIRAVLRYNIL